MDKYRGNALSRRKRHGPPGGKLPLGQASIITHGQASGCDNWFGSSPFFANMATFHIDPTPSTLPHTLDRCSSYSPASLTSTDRVDRTDSLGLLPSSSSMADPGPKKTLSLAHLKQPTLIVPPEPPPRRYVWRHTARMGGRGGLTDESVKVEDQGNDDKWS